MSPCSVGHKETFNFKINVFYRISYNNFIDGIMLLPEEEMHYQPVERAARTNARSEGFSIFFFVFPQEIHRRKIDQTTISHSILDYIYGLRATVFKFCALDKVNVINVKYGWIRKINQTILKIAIFSHSSIVCGCLITT